MAGLVVLCLCVQALLIPAQRISERTHFHLSHSLGSWLATTSIPSPSVAQAVFAHPRTAHSAEAPHLHSDLQDHDHGERVDVVYVGDPPSPSLDHHTVNSKRLTLDQDGLRVGVMPVHVATAVRVGFSRSAVRLSTRTELPLERPPRA